jgi:hypothetical protein
MPTDYNTERKQPKQDNKNRYVNQPQHHGWEELTPQMKSFWSDFSNLAYQKTGRYPKLTSGKRTPEQKVGKAHETSKHNEGNAIDMSADFAMYNVLYNTPDGLTLLNSYNLGVLDETNPETIAKTGATGPHYHIGTDPGLISKTKQRYSSYTENGNIDIVGLERDLTQAEFKIYAPAAQQLEEDIAVEIKKEEKKEEKEEKSESRKKVSPNKEKSFFSDIKIEQEKQQDFEPFQDTPETKVPDILSDYSSISSYVQTSLPKIPSLFKEITTEDLDKMQDGGDLDSKVGLTVLPEYGRSYYNPILDRIYLNPFADKKEIDHELVHAWQNRTGGLRSDPLSPKLRPSAAASDEQAATYFNRKGDDVQYYLENLQSINPEMTGNIWTPDMSAFIPEDVQYNRAIEPLMYYDFTTMEGEAERMSQEYGAPPLQINHQDGGEIVSSYGWDYKKEGDKYLTKRTGSENWIEATGEPLKAIKQKIYKEIPYTKEDKQSDYVNNVKQLIDKGYTLDNLVEKRIGTKEGLLNLFPELSSNKKEAEKSKEGEVIFKSSNRLFENKISNDILDVDTRLKFEINLDNIKERVKLDLKNRSSNLTQNETSEQSSPKREYEISPENLVEATRQFNENKFVVEDRFQPTKSQEESEKLTYRELSEQPSSKREYEISPENLVEATRQFNEEAQSVSKTSSSLEKIIEEDSFKNKVDKIKSNLSEEQKEAFSALVNSTKNAIFKYSKEIPILKDIAGDINITKNIPDYSRFVKSPTADIFREDIIEPEYKYGMSTDDLLKEKGYMGKGIGSDPYIDCSGAVCKVMTSLGKDLGNPLNTNAQKIHDKTKEIKDEKDWKDGDIITFKTDSNRVDHVGFLVIDENSGEKFIAESSRSFQEGRVVPFEQRLDFLYNSYPNMKYYIRRFDK